MKKYLLVLLIILVLSSLAFAQSITINNIGMYVDVVGDQTGEAGETVHVRVDYTTSSMWSITQTHWATTNFLNQFILVWYDNNDPNSGTLLDLVFVATSNFVTGSTGTNVIATFDFVIPSSSIPTNAESFQIGFGLYGMDITWSTFYGTQLTSYIADLGTSATVGNPPSEYYEYIDYVGDISTDAPTMVLPANNQHDNNPTEIEFFLPEAATDGSVKLSFTRSGEDIECTIESEAQGTHNFNINPSDLSSASEIPSVSGGNSLTQDVAYTVTIEYQDALGNPIASNSNTGYVYDTVTQAPTLDQPLANATVPTDFTIQYDQPETAYEDSVKIILTRTTGSLDSGSPHVLLVEREAFGTDITIDIKGGGLGGATGVSVSSGGNTLVHNSVYTIRIEYYDLAQNTAAWDENSGILYFTNDLIEISGGDYNAGTSFSPGSTNNAFFRIQMNKTGSGGDPTVSQINFDLLGSFQDVDIDAIRIWRSTDATFDPPPNGDTLLDSDTSWPVDPFVANFDPSQSIGTTIVYYFLTIDVSSTAGVLDAIGAEITSSTDITASTSIVGTFPITGSTHPLPVTLTSFTVGLSGKPVINWETQSETNNAYWNIYRGISQNMGQAIQINYGDMILGQGTVTEPTTYTYTDNFPILENTTYYYWLECVDNAGEADLLGPVTLFVPEGNGNNGTPATPDDYGLKQNYPNPFNPDTRINFALDYSSPVQLTIYNIKGEKIKTIFDSYVTADDPPIVQTAYWDGKDENGKNVASGVYLYRLRTNKTEYNRRMLLMK